jgi:hypothetical protein
MTPRSITIDDFQQLDCKDLLCALRLIELEVAGTLQLLATDELARQDPALLDELTSVLTLRKVFRLRLVELQGEEAVNALPKLGVGSAPMLTRERYPARQALALS